MKRAIAPVLMLGLLAGCGGQQATVDAQVRGKLSADVSDVKSAVGRKDRPAAESALAKLNRDIAASQAQGKLDANTAGTILEAADRVAEDVRTIVPPPPPPVTVTKAPETSEEQSPGQDLEDQIRQRISEQMNKHRDKQDKHGGN